MSSKTRRIVIWIGRILVAAMFIMAGSQKLMGTKMMVDEFNVIGLGQWFRYVTGTMEVGGALMLLSPKNSFYGTLVLLCVLVGAFVAEAFVLHGDVVHVVALAAIIGALAWFQRPGTTTDPAFMVVDRSNAAFLSFRSSNVIDRAIDGA